MHDVWRVERVSSLHLQVLDSASAALSFPSFLALYFLLLGRGSRPLTPSVPTTDNFLTTFPFSFLPLFYPFFFLFYLFFFSCRNQMGNLLKVLTCTELEQGPNFFLDFESEHSTDGKKKENPPRTVAGLRSGLSPLLASIHPLIESNHDQ